MPHAAMNPATRDAIERIGDRTERLPLRRRPASEALPITIHRRRIYVLPTGFGLFFSTVLAALVIGALNYNNNPGLIFGFLLVAAAHNSLVHAHLLLSGLELRSLHSEPVHAGQTLTVRLRFENHSPRPRYGLELRSAQARCPLDLPAQASVEIELPQLATRRGWLTLERLRIDTLRPLGLARAWSWLRPDTALLVYPALDPEAPPLPEALGDGESPRSRSHGEQPHHLRDYRPGDAPRQIAWKASARSDRMLVREYEASTARELTLDWAALAPLDHEARISRLARWVVEAERSGSRYGLNLPNERLPAGRGPEHRHACLRALALLPAAPGFSTAGFATAGRSTAGRTTA